MKHTSIEIFLQPMQFVSLSNPNGPTIFNLLIKLLAFRAYLAYYTSKAYQYLPNMDIFKSELNNNIKITN